MALAVGFGEGQPPDLRGRLSRTDRLPRPVAEDRDRVGIGFADPLGKVLGEDVHPAA